MRVGESDEGEERTEFGECDSGRGMRERQGKGKEEYIERDSGGGC